MTSQTGIWTLNKVNLLLTGLVITVFTKELFTRMIAGIQVDIFGYAFSFLVFLWAISSFRFDPGFLTGWFFVIVTSLMSLLILDLPFFPFVKQAFPITVTYFAAYFLLDRYRKRLPQLFDIYLRIAFYTAVFGIIQYALANAFGINILIKYAGKLDSIAYEGSHYAALIMPAVVFTLFQFNQYKVKAVVFTLTLLLTFSLTSYVVLLLAFGIYKLKPIWMIILIPLFYGAYLFLPLIHAGFNDRILAFNTVFETGEYSTAVTNMGTAASMGSNLDVALFTLEKNPVTGSGLGGHETMYDRKFANSSFRFDWFYELNKKSGHSLLIRIFSELGILGALVFIYIIASRYIRSRVFAFHHYVSLACVSHFLCKCFKLGGYFDYGTAFFFCLLLVNFSVYKVRQKQSANKNRYARQEIAVSL